MSTPIDGTTYPFDPTGQLASNLIPAEMQILTAQNYRDFHFIVPNLAPYFTDSLVITFQDTNGNIKTLTEGVDYVCTHVFHDASLACAKPIAGSISFYDTLLAGQVQLKYQTLGGIWTIDQTAIETILADRLHNPRITTWEQVTEQPVTFPVIDHEWNLVDLVGMSDVVNALANIEDMLRQTGSTGLAAHIADHNNPHLVTAAQVNLGNVQNYATATNQDAITGTATNLYMTPAATAAAIANLPSGGLAVHEADHGNPHVTTATQVGLGLVQNFGIASVTDAQNATRDDVYMTPLKTSALIGNGFGQDLANHEDDFTNSHRVTAHQTGAYTEAEVDALLANKINAGQQVSDSAMVYGLTQPELTSAILAGNAATASNATQVYGLTQSALAAAILAGTASNASNFGGQSPSAYAASVLEGKAADSALINGQTPADFATSISSQVLSQVTGVIGTIATQSVVAQATGSGPMWTQIATIALPVTGTPALPDMQMILSGGDSYDDTTGSGLYMINLSCRGAGTGAAKVSMSVINLNGVATGAVFGFTMGTSSGGGQTAILWAKTKGDMNVITATELSQQSFAFTTNPTPQTTEPSGITYATEDGFAKESEVVNALESLTTAFNNLKAQITGA